ncbi:MAG: ATP-binding protein, partial [Acidobacteriota bacterium]
MKRSPYVIGQWVRDERFYGRCDLLDELAEARSGSFWLAGLRRIGKTSVLRQLERRVTATHELALYWDVEDADDVAGLGYGLRDALYEVEESFADAEIDVTTLNGKDDDPFGLLEELAERINRRGRKMLFLWDEAEALHRLDAMARHWLRAALERFDALRVIAVSAPRLVEGEDLFTVLDAATPTATRLERRILGPLTPDAALAVVRQDQLPRASRPVIDPATTSAIARHTGGHPYLTQLLAKRWLECGDVDIAVRELAADRSLRFFFEVDMSLIDAAQHDTLRAVQRGDAKNL